MQNCNDEFQKFLGEIRLTKSKKDDLVKARDALRGRIKKKFAEQDKKSPGFYQQGSFAFKTTNNPLDRDYDVDDGVYLNHLPEKKDDWPSTETVHKLIVDAVEGHTNAAPSDKKKCIRVEYLGDYHVDLPIYAEHDGSYYLAVKGDSQWDKSDPKKFKEWFYEQLDRHDEQMRRIILYLKAWADFNSVGQLKGIIITVLVSKHINTRTDRDDISLRNTIESIVDYLNSNKKVTMPVEPYDNLLERLSDSSIETLIERLSKFKDIADEALDCKEKSDATKKWIKAFGPRFPNVEKTKMESKNSAAPISISKPPQPYFGDD